MIRAHRVSATAQDDAGLVSGWNISPNLAYVLRLLPGPVSCAVLLYDDANVLIATGAALAGTDQQCVLLPQTGQTIGMLDAELGWHLILGTTGTESPREIRIHPVVDLPDEIHPVYGAADLAVARATAAIDEAAHYRDDVSAMLPLGNLPGLGAVVNVPVDGAVVAGQVESITWTATPSVPGEQAVIRRHVAIAPDGYVDPPPPAVANDTGAATHMAGTSGNVLANDDSGLTVVAVNGLSSNVGVAVDGDNGGLFVINSDGSWTFAPDGDFALLSGSETAETSVEYHASDGTAESMATLIVTVSHQNTAPVAVGDTGETDAATATSGNVLANDTDVDVDALVVSRVAGSAANVGVAVAGLGGGLFTISSDGAWTFDPNSEFDSLPEGETATTSVPYHVSDGVSEGEGTLIITVSPTQLPDIALIAQEVAGTTSAPGYSFTFSLPDGLQPGDLVIIAGALSSNTAGPSSSGWTTVAAPFANDTYPTGMRVMYRVMPDPVIASVTVNCTTTGVVLAIQAFRGVDQISPLDVVGVTASGANGAYVINPDITTVTDGTVVIVAGAIGSASGQASMSPPSGYADTLIKAQSRISVAMASQLANTAGAVSGGAWTGISNSSQNSWAAVTLALRPE